MVDTGSKYDLSVDLGDELLHVPSLWDFFIEKTVIDAKRWFTAHVSSPPWGILIGLVAATVFFGFLKSMIAFLLGIFSLGMLVWIIFIRNGNTISDIESIVSNVNNGIFPSELKDTIIKRLRWWSALIVPSEWTKNSKIFMVREKLTTRLDDLTAEISFWKSPEGQITIQSIRDREEAAKVRHEEYQRKLNLLKSRGVNVNTPDVADEISNISKSSEAFSSPDELLKVLRSRGECERQLVRISHILEPIERANQEIILVNALLQHCDRIITMIDEVEKLNVAIETVKADNLNEKVKEILAVLEKRRSLVGKLNRIAPKKVLGIVDYNPLRAQSEISKERFLNERR